MTLERNVTSLSMSPFEYLCQNESSSLDLLTDIRFSSKVIHREAIIGSIRTHTSINSLHTPCHLTRFVYTVTSA